MCSKLILLTLLVLVHVNFEFVQAPWIDFDNDDDDYYDDDDYDDDDYDNDKGNENNQKHNDEHNLY